MTISKLFKREKSKDFIEEKGRFEKFFLTENPFPSEPYVNIISTDQRINGSIYEMEIRKKEYEKIKKNFIKVDLDDKNHLRLGYIVESSYVGRGNGKSAFLLYLTKTINKNFALDISDNVNKCFSILLNPEPGGRTKTFNNFIDLFFNGLIKFDILKKCIAILRLNALSVLNNDMLEKELSDLDEDAIFEKLNDIDWLKEKKINLKDLTNKIFENEYLQKLSSTFPLLMEKKSFVNADLITQESFIEYYKSIKKLSDKINFIFNDLVYFFKACDFNGMFLFVDDFERIPDFQSHRQKRDFALELRTCLFDGMFANSRIGFYNFLLVMHPGVLRLLQDAWSESGMENRTPISSANIETSKHIIGLEKLSDDHVFLLIQKYLSAFRIKDSKCDALYPFQKDSIIKISEQSEYNASKILKLSYEILDKISLDSESTIITKEIVEKHIEENKPTVEDNSSKTIVGEMDSVNLSEKAQNVD